MRDPTSTDFDLLDPHIVGSLRVRVLSKSPFRRALARGIVRLTPHLFSSVSGAYAGHCKLSLGGTHFKYILGARDTIGDVLYWLGERHWEADVVPIFHRIARNANGLILDCGANFGIYSLLACATNPKVRVIAWEPVPLIHHRLTINVTTNGFESRIDCRQAALSEQSGEATFFLHPDATMGSLSGSVGETTRVPLETADEVVPPDLPVCLVKIDVEGHESNALNGMRGILRRDSPPVIFEALNADSWQMVAAVLNPLGYSCSVISVGSTSPCTEFVPKKTNYLAQRIENPDRTASVLSTN